MQSPLFLSVLLAAGGGGCAPAEPPKTFELTYTVASGEPGAPPETVTVAWSRGKATVRLQRPGIRGGPAVEETASLTPDDCMAVWVLVERGDLLRFRPREQAPPAYDFGSRTVKITADPPPAGRPRQLEARWTHPLDNGEPISRLENELGRLARARLTQAPLFLP